MRIACITTSYPAYEGDPSGHFVLSSVQALERAGHEVTVLAPPSGDRSPFGWPGVAARVRERPLRAAGAARWMALAMLKLLRADMPDRIVAHWALPCAFPIAFVRNAPLVVVSHGGDVRLLAALPSVARNAIARTIAERCVEWHFASARLEDDLLRTLAVAERQAVGRVAMVVAPRLTLPPVRHAIASAREAMRGASYSVVVGRLVPSKRVECSLRFAKATAPDEPVVVVGDGPSEPALRSLALEIGLDALFLGKLPRDTALGFLGGARRLLFASQTEGLSTVVREAEALDVEVAYVNG